MDIVTVIDNLKTGRLSNLKKSKRKIKFIKADITKGNLDNYFKNHDYVFHLAGLADIYRVLKIHIFILMPMLMVQSRFWSMLKKTKLKNLSMLQQLVAMEYPKKYPTKEGSLTDPQYPYALSKFLENK